MFQTNKRMRNLRLPKKNDIKSAIASFSKKEHIVFFTLVIILFISSITLLEMLNKSFMVSKPARGGSISEGVVGAPRFINPVLAFSDTDLDMVSLVYSGLMRKDNEGNLVPDLAKEYTVSKDGLIYDFILKDKIYFSDGKPVTADDIIFTINEIKNPINKSPIKSNWDGVTVEKITEKNIRFTLKQCFASFLENTAVGILPVHIWKDSHLELNDANINPIGSGIFTVSKVSKQSSGIVDYVDLVSNKKFALGRPYIDKVTMHFYSNENELISALENGDVNQISSITPKNANELKEKGYEIKSSVLPRVFGLFFNQNQNKIFTDKKIVEAINTAIDKEEIIDQVLGGYGVSIEDPIPPNMEAYQKNNDNNVLAKEERIAKAKKILENDGWKIGSSGFLEKSNKKTVKTTTKNSKKTTTVVTSGPATYLEFSISTGNTEELMKTANLIKQDLEAIGMKVDIKTFEIGNLNQSVIRPRQYDALLFGQIINKESDLFAFWHSSQRNDPGLNVAMYTNSKVDKILEDAFTTTDEDSRIKKYAQCEAEIKKDMPAVFLYSPDFIYVVSKDLKGISLNKIISPSDRFLNSYLWYVNTEDIWKIFSK